MKRGAERPPIDYLPAPLDEQRVARMWTAIEQRTSRRGHTRRFAAAFAVAALVACGWGLAAQMRSSGSAVRSTAGKGSIIATTTRETLTLPDGSEAELAARTQLSVVRATENDVRLSLRSGEVTLAVSHRPNRKFEVEAGGTVVTVRGTKFRVSVLSAPKPSSVSVQVMEGQVEISDDSDHPLASLQAGQSWSSHIPVVSSAAPIPLAAVPALSDSAPARVVSSENSTAKSATDNRSQSTRSVLKTEQSTALLPSATPTASSVPTAEAMLAEAKAARLARRTAEAAATFDRLRQTYPNDPRAGVAAFELGRIRIGELGDPQGALEAFRFAARHAGAGAFREDVEAGIIDALAVLGRTNECQRALESFEKHSPNSVHRRRLNDACGKK